jgi:hypothetical protein
MSNNLMTTPGSQVTVPPTEEAETCEMQTVDSQKQGKSGIYDTHTAVQEKETDEPELYK